MVTVIVTHRSTLSLSLSQNVTVTLWHRKLTLVKRLLYFCKSLSLKDLPKIFHYPSKSISLKVSPLKTVTVSERHNASVNMTVCDSETAMCGKMLLFVMVTVSESHCYLKFAVRVLCCSLWRSQSYFLKAYARKTDTICASHCHSKIFE